MSWSAATGVTIRPAKGPRLYDWAAAKLPAVSFFGAGEPSHRRWVMAQRSIARPDEIAYYLAYAPAEITVDQLVKVVCSRWAIESSFQSAKNECGLDQYEVRRYIGWYRHVTLAMLAHAFLAAVAAQGITERRAAETDHPSPRSRWQKSARLLAACRPRAGHRARTETVPLAPQSPSHRQTLPLPATRRRSRTPAT